MFRHKLLRVLLDLVILKLLNVEPMHGYKIIEEIRKSFGVLIAPSSLYPTLGALKTEKYIVSESISHKDNNKRKTYKITSQGQQLLDVYNDKLTDILFNIH